MPLNKIREYILENNAEKVKNKSQKTKTNITTDKLQTIYIRENVCDIFEIHYSEENGKKYKHIIENVKKYVEKMMEN